MKIIKCFMLVTLTLRNMMLFALLGILIIYLANNYPALLNGGKLSDTCKILLFSALASASLWITDMEARFLGLR